MSVEHAIPSGLKKLSRTVNISNNVASSDFSDIDNYKSLTVDNFFVELYPDNPNNPGYGSLSSYSNDAGNLHFGMTKTYNPSTGVVSATFSQVWGATLGAPFYGAVKITIVYL